MAVLLAVRHQQLFLSLLMFVTALQSTRDFAPELVVSSSGVSLYPDDVFTAIAAIAALFRITQWRVRGVARGAVLAFVGLAGMGVLAWISTYGLEIGTTPWRPQILAATLLIYAITRPRAWTWNDLRSIIIGPAILLALASIAGILMYGLGSNSTRVDIGGTIEGNRPIAASGALLMLVALWIIALSPGKWGVRRLLLVALLGSMVVLTQHRSVWVATILGVVAWWLAPRFRQGGALHRAGGFSRTVLIFFVGAGTALVGSSVAVLGQSAGDGVTFKWRADRWIESMRISRSWIEWVAGSAFGPTPASTPTLFPTSAHSLYVGSIEMIGIVGLLASLYLLLALTRTHLPQTTGPVAVVIGVALLGYGVTYQVPGWGWMLVGLMLASSRTEATEATEQENVPARVRVHYSEVPEHESSLVRSTSRIE